MGIGIEAPEDVGVIVLWNEAVPPHPEVDAPHEDTLYLYPMSEDQEPMALEQLLDRIDDLADERERVSLDEVLDVVGRRSFGPILIVVGLAMVAPIIGDIPGVPTMLALIVLLVAAQLLLRRECFWLPSWLIERSVKGENVLKVLRWLRSPARFVDRFLERRLTHLAGGPATYVIGVVCILIALATPVMELVPFSANGAGAALTAFGLSLLAHDGLLALIAFLVTTATIGAIAFNVL